MFYGQCFKCGESWALGTERICKCPDELLAEQPAQQERPNFAEWASDYVRDNLHKLKPEQGQWDAIPDAFNEWWNADYDDTGNPYRKDSPAYWAWSGWKAASKQPAQQEPVAAECNFVGTKEWGRCSIEHHNLVQSEPHKWPDYQTRLLYTSPPAQRTWIGLTDEDEIDWEEGGNLKDLVKAIEAKLKEKNT